MYNVCKIVARALRQNTFQYIKKCKKVDTMRHKMFFKKRYCTLTIKIIFACRFKIYIKIGYKLAITNHAQKSKLLHLLSHVTNNLSDSAVE